MAITNKIICSSTYREEDYSSMMLCEYEVISNSPFKVSAVLRWQDSVVAQHNASIEEARRQGRSASSWRYDISHGCAMGGQSKLTYHEVKADRRGNYYFTKKAGEKKYKIYL